MSNNSMHTAHGLFQKALSSGREGNAADERAAYDEIISRFSGHEDPEMSGWWQKHCSTRG